MDVTIRPATIADVEILTHHRRSMFEDMGHSDQAALDSMCVAFRPWVIARMESGEYFAWLAVDESGAVASGAGLWLMDWPPHMIGGTTRRGNIVNVYTRPDCRRRGLARRLMETALDWSRNHGIKAVILHASDEGRELYLRMGFKPSNEMRMILP
jgi:GNAT superfamily N-acetyltransferase